MEARRRLRSSMEISRQEAICILVLACVLLLGAAALAWSRRPVEPPSVGPAEEEQRVKEARSGEPPSHGPGSQPEVVIHVTGAVARPGVYSLAKGARVVDAVTAAGGPTSDAALDAVNLAARLDDGQKVHILTRREVQAGIASGGSSGYGPPPRVNLNTASTQQLETLPGIGPSLAAAIIDYRRRVGAFRKPEDLMKVGGIGSKTFARIKDLITVD